MAANTPPNFLGMLWKSPTQSKWSKFHTAMTRRPRKEEMGQAGVDTFAEWQLPPHPIAYRDMYNLAKLQVNVRTSVKHLVWELVRRGVEWKPLWTARCNMCGQEYHSINSFLPCPECGGDMVAPNPKEYEWADGKLKNCNANHQHILSVIESLSEDHHVTDEGYMVIRKEYSFDKDGNIALAHVKEIIRGSPLLFRPVSNPKTGNLGWAMQICPVHREHPVMVSEDVNRPYSVDNPNSSIKKCEAKGCKCVLYPVHYVSLKIEGGEPEDYFIEGEIINRHIYGTNLLYGTPPMLTLWPIAAALFYQETYIRDSFERKRIPNGALLVNTSNATGFLKFWKQVTLELKNDPHFVPVIPLETEPGATQQGRVNFVKFMDSLKEMDFIATRDEFRQRIASFYGVSTMFMADTRQTGGGNLNEGSQLIVSSRSIERIQKVWNEYYLPRLSQMMGVRNWVLQIKPTEDRDLLKDLQKEQLQLQNNQMYTTIGYTSEQDPYNGEWMHKKDFAQELEKSVQVLNTLSTMTSGGMGGMGGGTGDDMQSYEPNPKATEKGEDVDYRERGIQEEMKEHGKTREEAEKIYEDHTKEDPDYYKKLDSVGLLGKAVEIEKAKQGGTPTQGTTNMSSPMKMKTDPRGGKKGTPPSSRVRDAPGSSPAGGYKCKFCGQSFNDKRGLGGHMKARHPGSHGEDGGGQAGPAMEGEVLPDPDAQLHVLTIMRDSQMFDPNIIAVMEAALGTSEYPTEEAVRGKGYGGERATPSGYNRQRKYS